MRILQGFFAAALGRVAEDKSVKKDLGNDIRITKETVSSTKRLNTTDAATVI